MQGRQTRPLGRIPQRQRLRAADPRERPFVAPAQELHIAQFPAGRRRMGQGAVLTNGQGLMQGGGALFVAAVRGANERSAQRHARARAQRHIAHGVGLDDGAAQALQARIQRAGANGGLTGLDLREHGGAATGGPADRRGREGAVGRLQRGTRLDAELANKQFTAGGRLARRRAAVTGRRERAHQQRLVVLFQCVQAHEPARQVGGLVHGTRRQPGQRGFAKHGLGGRLHVPPLRRQPHVEGRAVGKRQAFQQLMAQARGAQRLGPGSRDHAAHVHIGGRRQRQIQDVAAQRRVAEQPPQLGQVPAQGGQRVFRVLEQQTGQVPAADRSARAQQVGQQRPGLVAPGRRHRHAVALDARRAQQVDRKAHGPLLRLRPRPSSGRSRATRA